MASTSIRKLSKREAELPDLTQRLLRKAIKRFLRIRSKKLLYANPKKPFKLSLIWQSQKAKSPTKPPSTKSRSAKTPSRSFHRRSQQTKAVSKKCEKVCATGRARRWFLQKVLWKYSHLMLGTRSRRSVFRDCPRVCKPSATMPPSKKSCTPSLACIQNLANDPNFCLKRLSENTKQVESIKRKIHQACRRGNS